MILQRLNIGKKDWAASLAHSKEGGESGTIPWRDLILLLLLEAPTGTRALCSASVWGFFPPSILCKVNVHVCSASKLLAESTHSSADFSSFSTPGSFGKKPFKQTKLRPTIFHLSWWPLCGKQRWHNNSERNFPFVISFSPFLFVLSLLLS